MRLRKKFNVVKYWFLMMQLMVIGLVIGISAIFSTQNIMRNSSDILRNYLNDLTLMVHAQLDNLESVSYLKQIDRYLIFTVHPEEGRTSRVLANGPDDLWQMYESKLLYEMQKKGEGWVQYPDKDAWDLRSETRMIRYMRATNSTMIIAVETRIDSELDLMRKLLDKNILWVLLILFLVAVAISASLTFQWFDRLLLSVKDFNENNVIRASEKNHLKGDSTKEPYLVKKTGISSIGERHSALEREWYASMENPTLTSFKDNQSQETTLPPKVIPQPELENPIIEETRMPESPVDTREEPIEELPSQESASAIGSSVPPKKAFDDIVINTKSIKSTVLKDMIEQMRRKGKTE